MATVKQAQKNPSNDLSTTVWMVRAGERGFRFEDFKEKSLVGVDWHEVGDMSSFETRDDFKRGLALVFPQWSAHELGNSAGQLYRFVREIKEGETVITYDTASRVYLIGSIRGGYEYQSGLIDDQPNIRRVSWVGSVPRDALSVSSRNSLGSTLTVFSVPPEAVKEFIAFVQNGNKQNTPTPNETIVRAEVDDLFKDQQLKSLEFIKDKVSALDWEEMQELVAGLLRAMGYKTRISPSGSDRGKDIVASPDGLGFEDPRIVVEVKHRSASMGSQEIRSFLGGRHANDKGLYVSTGGFSKDARYEAERAAIPLTLMDLDDLVKSLLDHYEKMDVDMQRLIPLRKIYWPV
jgi:restriction system protein